MLEKEINDNRNCLILVTDKLEEKNRDLQEFRKQMLEGKLVRSRAKWIYEGEKPTSYFLQFGKQKLHI